MFGKAFWGTLGLICVATAATAADPDRTIYRFEKHVAAHAGREGNSKLAADAYYVGLLGVRRAGDHQHVEEFLTGGLLHDLGEDLPPRPAGEPIRRTYTLDKQADVTTPLTRRPGLALWMLPFEYFLTPHESPAELISARQGLQDFASHAMQPAVSGTWSWRLVKEDAAQGTCTVAGPCTGKFADGMQLGGCLARVLSHDTGAIQSATADLSITMPVTLRLQSLDAASERRHEEEEFLRDFDIVVVRETVRMHRHDLDADGAIDLPLSLATALAKLRQEAEAK